MNCPECNSQKITKNGFIHNGKQKFCCKDCGRQFIETHKIKLFLLQHGILLTNYS